MNPVFKHPPRNKADLTPPEAIADILSSLIGQRFTLSGKTRTDGANLRKLVAGTLEAHSLPEPCDTADFQIIPPKGKGVPRILLEYIDTYIVTSGKSYNLQVWNRNPASKSVQIQYSNGSSLNADEVRFVLVKIDVSTHTISSIFVLTPEYIVRRFGRFGKPTVKQQLIISGSARQAVLNRPNGLLFYDDESPIGKEKNVDNLRAVSIHSDPHDAELLPLSIISAKLQACLLGAEVSQSTTKTRGQYLEQEVAEALGYQIGVTELLAGGYPDIRNQMLEVKIQDSPTVDLGMYTPEFEEDIPNSIGFTTKNVRYFIALTNPETNRIEGAIICPGNLLGEHFTYVGDKSYKCQRSIKMDFFAQREGQAVFNPDD
jgi:hypothetical protein